jgi:hypothetical protein
VASAARLVPPQRRGVSSCHPGNSPSIDLMGIAVGHIYYYCEDIYPYTLAGPQPLVAKTWPRPPLEKRPTRPAWCAQNVQAALRNPERKPRAPHSCRGLS